MARHTHKHESRCTNSKDPGRNDWPGGGKFSLNEKLPRGKDEKQKAPYDDAGDCFG